MTPRWPIPAELAGRHTFVDAAAGSLAGWSSSAADGEMFHAAMPQAVKVGHMSFTAEDLDGRLAGELPSHAV